MRPRASSLSFLQRPCAPCCLILAVALLACGGREGEQQPAVRELAPEPQAAAPAPRDTAREAARRQARAANLARDEAMREAARAARERNDARLGGRVTIEAGGAAIELPADYPADVPLHPAGTPVEYVASPVTGAMTTLDVGDSPQSIRNFYLREMSQAGWEIDTDQSLGPLTIMSARKGGRQLAVTIEDKQSTSQVVLVEGAAEDEPAAGLAMPRR